MNIRGAELSTVKSLDEFLTEWKRQGHEVLKVEPNWVTLRNNQGKVFECIVLGDLIAPFDFGGQ